MAKYIAKVPSVGGKFRYIYKQEELTAHNAKKSKGNGKGDSKASDKKSKKKKTGKGIFVPSGHIASSSPGSVISGYTPGGEKPSKYTDEEWAKLQELWFPKRQANASVQKKKPSLSYVRMLTKNKKLHKTGKK